MKEKDFAKLNLLNIAFCDFFIKDFVKIYSKIIHTY
jgi:hypothetical protein